MVIEKEQKSITTTNRMKCPWNYRKAFVLACLVLEGQLENRRYLYASELARKTGLPIRTLTCRLKQWHDWDYICRRTRERGYQYRIGRRGAQWLLLPALGFSRAGGRLRVLPIRDIFQNLLEQNREYLIYKPRLERYGVEGLVTAAVGV